VPIQPTYKLGLFFQIKLNFSSFSTLFHLFFSLFWHFSLRKLALFFQIAYPEKLRIYSHFSLFTSIFLNSTFTIHILVTYYTNISAKCRPNSETISITPRSLFSHRGTEDAEKKSNNQSSIVNSQWQGLRETASFVCSAYCVLRAKPFILSEDEGLTPFFVHHEGHREPRRKIIINSC